MKKPGRHRTSYRVIQKHHVSYTPEETCLMFRSEHDIITKLNRLLKSKPSAAFMYELFSHARLLWDTCWYTPDQMFKLQEKNRQTKKKRRKK